MKNAPATNGQLQAPPHDAVVLTTPSATFTLHPCGPLDSVALSDFTEAHFKNDYYFRKGHWREVLSSDKYQVYAVSQIHQEFPAILVLCGIVVGYLHSRLLNLYLKPEFRRSGLGAMIIEALSPDEIRAKVDWSDGDPTEFYTKQGYHVVQSRQGKNANITILRRSPQKYTDAGEPSHPPENQPRSFANQNVDRN